MIGKTSSPMKDTEGYLTEEQFNHLVSYVSNERDRVLFRFLFYTGRRVSEVVKCLTPRDFNFRDNLIHFTILKKGRPIKMWLNVNSNIMEMMREYIDSNNFSEDDFIFHISRFRVDQIIKKLGERAGLLYVGKKKIHAHTLRHSYAVMMSQKVKDIYELKKLQNLMGHANINTTSYYFSHFSPKGMKEFVES